MNAPLEMLQEYLEAFGKLRKMYEERGEPLRMPISDTEVILEFGKPMVRRHKLDEKVVQSKTRQCYANAWSIKNRRRAQNLRYCEGYVQLESCPIPVHHGWCLNEYDEVVDPSVDQNESAVYYGVEYYNDFAKTAWAALRQKQLIGIMLNMYALKSISEKDFYNGIVKQ